MGALPRRGEGRLNRMTAPLCLPTSVVRGVLFSLLDLSGQCLIFRPALLLLVQINWLNKMMDLMWPYIDKVRSPADPFIQA